MENGGDGRPSATRPRALLVWAALCSGPVVLPVVAAAIGPLLAAVDQAELLRTALSIPAFAALAFAALWRFVLLPRALVARKFVDALRADTSASEVAGDAAGRARRLIEQCDQRFFSLNLVGIAMAEGGGLFAGIALLLLGLDSSPSAVAAGLSIVLLTLHCPTAARFDEAARQLCAAAGVPLADPASR